MLAPEGPRYDQRFKDQVLAAHQDRMSLRGIQRTFGVYATAMRWLGEKWRPCLNTRTRLCPAGRATCSNSTSRGALWAARPSSSGSGWRSAAARARPWPWTLGDRSGERAAELRAALPKGCRGRATRSDGWEVCAGAFPGHTHRFCAKQDGQTCHVERWFCTQRQRVGRLVRRALSSKDAGSHLDAIHLFVTAYNLQIMQTIKR